MSRWAEMFQALSYKADTVDTVDTVDAESRSANHCVAQCPLCHGSKERKGRACTLSPRATGGYRCR
jgi:hypothetical protein